MTTVVAPPLVGQQTPTFLWMPPFEHDYGVQVVELAASAGLVLDEWQQSLCKMATALGPAGLRLCFELCVIVPRQNGKDSWLEAMELAWLLLFGEPKIIHTAHLFETSREHFFRVKALFDNNDHLSRRVKNIQIGRGSEEILLLTGQRLKFMTRSGGVGRGFAGVGKVIYNEAMYLDATMMASSLPTMSTVPNAQVIYAGSAGLGKWSTQLALLRRRGYARNDPSLMFAEWAAEPAVWGPQGELLAGDDPADPRTWAKVNPGIPRITIDYIGKEMRAFGGPRSPQFGTERLGIGDYPAEDEAWEVISQEAWESRADPESQIVDGSPIALALGVDAERSMGTIGVCGPRADDKDHVEIIERHRGTGWIGAGLTGGGDGLTDYELAVVNRVKDLKTRYKIRAVGVLKTSAAASLIAALVKAGLPVESPTDVEYAQACGDFYEAIAERGDLIHLGQASMTTSVAGGRKRQLPEGGWRWAIDAPSDAIPMVVSTIAYWAKKKFAIRKARPKIW